MIKHRLVIQNYKVNDVTLPGEKVLSTFVKWISEEQYNTLMSYLGESYEEESDKT